MQRRLTILVTSYRIGASFQKELRRIQAAVSAGIAKSRLDLLRIRFSRARATSIEMALKHIEPVQCRRTFHVQWRTAIRKKPGRRRLPIGEAAVNNGVIITGRPQMKTCAPIQQRLKESDLDAGPLRMYACGHQSECGTSAAVGVRLRVYFGACIYEQIRDLDDVLRGPLPEAFDTVGGDVM